VGMHSVVLGDYAEAAISAGAPQRSHDRRGRRRMNNVTNDAARRRAQEIWDRNKQRDVDARSGAQRAEAAKTARLRELRLAKEATDRETAVRQRAEQLHAKRRPRRRKSAGLAASESVE
jgi:hypothetical protein